MSRVLILTYRMALGYGVDVLVAEHARYLSKCGHQVFIGCIDKDSTYSDLNISSVAPTLKSVRILAEQIRPDFIFAHTSPFFEMLPDLKDLGHCWAAEAGDPTPLLFGKDKDARQKIKDHKEQNVYPAISGVISISDFISSDIHWPKAIKIIIGHEHLIRTKNTLGPKTVSDINRGGKIKIGTLMRLGKGEAFYKGNSLYIDLVNSLSSKYPGKFEFHFMGRGSPEEAKPFTEMGIVAHLNATDSQRDLFLRELDIFISFSLWEGFNLPLLEAQIMGTATIALDTGAHPEVTPLIADNMFDLENFVLGMSESPETLLRHSQNAFHWGRQRFKWQTSLKKLEGLVQQKSGVVGYSDIPQISIFAKSKLFVSRVNWALNTYGVRLLAVKIMRRLMRRLIKA
jgi:glycosyltransferase involved in cell wall biosynthesis